MQQQSSGQAVKFSYAWVAAAYCCSDAQKLHMLILKQIAAQSGMALAMANP
jgi:hypothetical protein